MEFIKFIYRNLWSMMNIKYQNTAIFKTLKNYFFNNYYTTADIYTGASQSRDISLPVF